MQRLTHTKNEPGRKERNTDIKDQESEGSNYTGNDNYHVKPSHRRFNSNRKQDLAKRETRKEVIEVSYQLSRKKKPSHRILKTGNAFTQKHVIKTEASGKQYVIPGQITYADVFKDYPNTEVVITNTCTEAKEFRLWGKGNYQDIDATSRSAISRKGDSNSRNCIHIDDPDHYKKIVTHFQFAPALVMHTRFVLYGEKTITLLKVNEIRPTGKRERKTLSMNTYRHPQHQPGIYEVHGLKGEIIDRKHEWVFKIPPMHTVNIMVWYKQLKQHNLIPKS